MLKVVKFGGSSMADAGQYKKVRDILLADPSRKVVIVSAAGKRFSGDHKLTDLLYLCHSHVKYGVDCNRIYKMISGRYLDIQRDLDLDIDLMPELTDLKRRIDAKQVTREELVSRGEYFSAKLMASYLGFQFIDFHIDMGNQCTLCQFQTLHVVLNALVDFGKLHFQLLNLGQVFSLLAFRLYGQITQKVQ